jgi:hypothetical protein
MRKSDVALIDQSERRVLDYWVRERNPIPGCIMAYIPWDESGNIEKAGYVDVITTSIGIGRVGSSSSSVKSRLSSYNLFDYYVE